MSTFVAYLLGVATPFAVAGCVYGGAWGWEWWRWRKPWSLTTLSDEVNVPARVWLERMPGRKPIMVFVLAGRKALLVTWFGAVVPRDAPLGRSGYEPYFRKIKPINEDD